MEHSPPTPLSPRKEKYMALEALLFKFRGQMSVIRELTAEKVQQLEKQVLEADRRAYEANQQVQWMEERLKVTDVQSGDSELKLFRHCQDLQAALQEKEELITSLEQQLEEQKRSRIQDAKTVEEKAAKIKEWVMKKLKEVCVHVAVLRVFPIWQHRSEAEPDWLRLSVLQQVTGRVGPVLAAPGQVQRLTYGCVHVPAKSPRVLSGLAMKLQSPEGPASKMHESEEEGEVEALDASPGGISSVPSDAAGGCGGPEVGRPASEAYLTASDDSSSLFDDDLQRAECLAFCTPGPDGTGRAKGHDMADLKDGPSDELNRRFRSHGLTSLTSSNKASTPSPVLTSAPTPKRPTPSQEGTPASPKQPRLRTPNAFSVNMALAKKHLSQPPPCSDAAHGRSRNAISMLRPLKPQETDLDQEPEMETGEPALPVGPLNTLAERGKTSDASAAGSKPPTPPLHRFPSWVSVTSFTPQAGSGVFEVHIRFLSRAAWMQKSALFSIRVTFSVAGDFVSLHNTSATPVYTTVKGVDTFFPLAFLGPAMSRSSMASESDYAIPPDAYSTDTECSEPENKLKSEPMEKSGYLLKMVKTWKKTWKRSWFVLKDGELLYYKSPSDVIRKPQGQIELSASTTISRGEAKQMLQLMTGKRVYNLKADSPNLLEEWLKVLQCVLRVKAASPLFTQPNVRPTIQGHLIKVKHGYSRRVWCALIGKTLCYFRCQEDKFPLGQIRLWEARVEEVARSCDPDEDSKSGQSAVSTISIQALNQVPTYLLADSQHEKVAWLYHLCVAAGARLGQVGTEFEQLLSELLLVDGDPGSSRVWRHPTLCFSKDGLTSPLTSLPSQALQTEAIKLFKTCQLFINVAIDTPAIDYHVTLAQCALQVCLTHPELQNEIYCQLIKQTRMRHSHGQPSPLQGWQFLALCVGLFLPQHPILWLLGCHLEKHADARTEAGKYAIYCQRSVERTQQRGERQARPSRMEILSILLRNPYHHSLPFSLPVHFLNSTYQVVGFDASTTVEEFQSRLNQDTGMRKTGQSGFSLYSDDPTGRNIEHYLHGSLKICDIIAKWEQACKELHTGKWENARTVKLTYKNRFYFSQQLRGETERERLLLAYQTNEEIAAGHFPVNKELALEMSALLAQVEFGDFEKPFPSAAAAGSAQAKSKQTLKQVLEHFYPKHYRRACTEEQLRQLGQRLSVRWASLRGRGSSECVRIYLTVARKWPFFGAKLFEAEVNVNIFVGQNLSKCPTSGKSLKKILTFGGCRQDFMLVIQACVFLCRAGQILELTLLLAGYINSAHQQKSAAHHLSAPALLLGQPHCGEPCSNSPPAACCRPSKAPTLL
uniref:Pleckstrin homology domain containing, family H (with MyTH4 domain) member 2 n=1 Tax=Electrophorus electricus TaxID=8005 RepID=A0A4W4FBF3_ELEEL